MKKIINAIRDFLYNITDYGLIITVVVVMSVILGWRFDILFNRGIDKEIIAEIPVISEPIKNTEPGDSDPANPNEPVQDDEIPEKTGLIATINIPEGSLPSTIGEILVSSNLINDKQAFLNKSVELGLDRKLKSGKFEIEIGTSLDNIIKIIAKAN